jgi:polysaccharide deacetylase family protein (PEP-CTERM system associated)
MTECDIPELKSIEAIMSVDVEEWFHIPTGLDNILPIDQWDQATQRVQEVIPQLLDLFDKNKVKSTFFFLGWIAEKHPNLVKETLRRGHEIATHGYSHRLIYNQTSKEFNEDVYRAKSIIENLTGRPVLGYRAPGFSITPETEWAFDILMEQGFRYDSSIFPGERFLGHHNNFNKEPVIVTSGGREIIEFPQTLVDFGLFRFSFFGGGYFRLFPAFFIKMMSGIIIKNKRPLIFYIHPRDIDTLQPKLHYPLLKEIRHYINISKTEEKLNSITQSLRFSSFEHVMSDPAFLEKLRTVTI